MQPIVVITKTNGECTTSISWVTTEFVAHFESLLGMELLGAKLDNNLLSYGPILNEDQ